MPGKSRHSKAKRSLQSRKERSQRTPPTVAAQQQPVPQAYKPAIPPVTAQAPMPELTITQHPYIFTELRRIGILAGIMLAILVVLALVSS